MLMSLHQKYIKHICQNIFPCMQYKPKNTLIIEKLTDIYLHRDISLKGMAPSLWSPQTNMQYVKIGKENKKQGMRGKPHH